MELNFKDKVVVVTGSGRGIGFAIAETFAQKQATVILSDYLQTALDPAIADFTQKGYTFDAIPCNVTDPENVEKFVETVIGKFGKIDVLINNAGVTRDNILLRMKDDQWNAVIETNLKGVFLMTRAISKHLIRQRFGKIINISSVVGLTGNIGQSNYSASKAGVIGFSKSIAQELASRNITVNIIAPGFIDTPMTSVLPDAVKEEFYKKIPLHRAGTPKDVAQVALFLASPLADYLTGQVIQVDGGMVM